MNVTTLDDLASAHRPKQIAMLERMVALFTTSDAVTHLLVRGSLACGTADRLSDVDLVVGVEDRSFAKFVAIHDALIQTEMGSVLPGWRDRIVGDMGGVGFVHLVAWGDELQQIDLYFAPSSRIGALEARTGARPVFERTPETACSETECTLPDFLPGAAELLVEVLVIGYMIRKRISRDQGFIAYAEANMLATAAKDLIKVALAPHSRYYGWYMLTEEIGITPIGRDCLRDLQALISGPAVPTRESLDRSLALVLAITNRAAPEALDAIRSAIDIYWHHLESP